MDNNPLDSRQECYRQLFPILQERTDASQDLSSVSSRQIVANFIAVCFKRDHISVFGETTNLVDLKSFIFILRNRFLVLFDKAAIKQQESPEAQASKDMNVDPDASLDNAAGLCWESSFIHSSLPNDILADFAISELATVGHNELLALKHFLDILASPESSKALVSRVIGTLVTMADVLFQVAPFSYHKNFACHMLASLLCVSSNICHESTSGPNEFSAAYDNMALSLGLVPDNILVFKANAHPEVFSREEAVSYFLKLATTLIRITRSNHFVLPNSPGFILEALFDVFFETFNPLCLDMCSDLIQLGSLKNMPIPAQLEYFIEILRTICNFLNIVNEDPKPGCELLRLEFSLARILIDVIDILPTSTHVMIRAHKQFASTVMSFSEIKPLTKALLDSVIHCVLVICPDSTTGLKKLFNSIQYSTPTSQTLFLKHAANISSLLPTHISYAVLSQDPLFQYADITGKQSRKASSEETESHNSKRLSSRNEAAINGNSEGSEETLRDCQSSFNLNTKELIKIRGLGNSGKDISSAIFSHLIYHSLTFLGPLYSGSLSSLAEVISIFEVGIRLLPKKCYVQLHLIVHYCLAPVFSYILAKQIQAGEVFYEELCSIATLFSFSANQLDDWSDETKDCYRITFSLFALVWKDTIWHTSRLDLDIFEEGNLEKLLDASKEDLKLLFKNVSKSLDLRLDNLMSIALSGMVAILPDSEIDHDFYFAFLLSTIFYSLQKNSPPGLQAHAWRIMPRAVVSSTFLDYLKTKNIRLLMDTMCREELMSAEIKDAFILNLGKLICSISASCSAVKSVQRQPFPTGELFCAYCDKEDLMSHKVEPILDKLPDSEFPKPLEAFPMQALVFLLNLNKEDVSLPERRVASLSICRALAHLPLNCYSELNNSIPQLYSLAMDECSEIRTIMSLLNLVSHEGSELKRIFLFKFVKFLFDSIRDNPSEFSLNLVLSLIKNLAKKAHPAALSFILIRLSEYLYHDDKQLHDIAAAHKIPLKMLYNSLWGSLDDFILNDLRTQGYFVSNMAMALQVNVSGLLKLAAPHLLPMVVINRDLEMLKKLAKLIEFDAEKACSEEGQVVDLCTEYLQYILAGLFLLDGKEQEVSLNFLYNLFKCHSFGESHIVKSCAADLTLVLALQLGKTDDDNSLGHEPEVALMAVAKVLHSERDNRKDLQPVQNLLVKHFMYIISSFNSFLSEYRYPQDYLRQVKALRALDKIIEIVDCHINVFIPQILSAVKSSMQFPFLASFGIKICYTLIQRMGYTACMPYVNQILAMFSECYSAFGEDIQDTILALFRTIYRMSLECKDLRVISLPDHIPELKALNLEVKHNNPNKDPVEEAKLFIKTLTTESFSVCVLALKDLYHFLLKNKAFVATLVLKEPISSTVDSMISALVSVCKRFAEMKNSELQYNAMLCFGILGAVDPDRLTPVEQDCQSETFPNLYTKEVCIKVARNLIESYLGKLYGSTMVVKDQFFIAYTIQELMKFCDFNASNVSSDYTKGVMPFSRQEWDKLPGSIVEMIRPLMFTDYKISCSPTAELEHPIFSLDLTFESWACRWTSFLILQVDDDITRGLFSPCFKVAAKYVNVATFLLPHLILALVLQDDDALSKRISQEMHAVLKVSADQPSGILLSKASQLIFSVLAHLSNWCILIREKIYSNPATRSSLILNHHTFKAKLELCQKFVQGISSLLLAQAAHKTQHYFHAVFYLEAYIREINAMKEPPSEWELNDLYTQLHDLYFQLDDIDGLQGVQSLFLVGNVQQQLREHEASKNWPAAQSCYEVLASTHLNPKACQQGIISCMKNMGSLDLATNHLAGLAAKLPSEDLIDDLQQAVDEASWRLGKWDLILEEPTASKPSIDQSISKLLLSAKRNNSKLFRLHLENSRRQLLAEFSGNISHSYVRGYNAVIWAHMLDDAATFHQAWTLSADPLDRMAVLSQTESVWSSRLQSTSPAFKVRENLLNFQRVLLDAHLKAEGPLDACLVARMNEMRSRSYVQCAKFARKAAYFQTSYRSLLEHLESDKPAAAKETAKWHWSQGQTWTAMGILTKLLGRTAPDLIAESYDSSAAAFSEPLEQSQVRLKLVKWMISTSACNQDVIAQEFSKLRKAQPEWEKCHFYATQYLFGILAQRASGVTSPRMVTEVITLLEEVLKCGHNCLKFSSKYVYQLLPRILTQWLHCNIAFKQHTKPLLKVNERMLAMSTDLPTYMFLPVFSQVVSRLNTDDLGVLQVINLILFRIIQSYPQQALWALVITSASKDESRGTRYTALLSKAKTDSSIVTIAEEIKVFCRLLREIANFPFAEQASAQEAESNLKVFLKRHSEFKPLSIVMPTQSALSFSLPSAVSNKDSSNFTPFPTSLVTIKKLMTNVRVMHSVMRPRQISLMGSDNLTYRFLCKPKDDLRKDSRLIELFQFLNRMFRQDPEARRRHLHIRTFAVIPLDQQCGLVEWVDNLEVLRACIFDSYRAHGIRTLSNDKVLELKNAKVFTTREARIRSFKESILPAFPPMLYRWFLKNFYHPTKWFAARSAFAHTMAVMSMVGFVVGLGDRHGENILLDQGTGDVVHVDFSSLFEVSIDLKEPERVPFRLTSNMVHALGVAGYEGTFRRSCEVTMTILRANRETLKALLETFLHDPLTDFLNKKAKSPDNLSVAGRAHFFRNIHLHLPYKNLGADSPVNNPDALWALDRISKKLDGKSSSFYPAQPGIHVQPISVEGQVLQLLQSATDLENLFLMYVGWGPQY